ncbi:MAG TPA: hypothetical protein VM616_05365 [Gammaproteobacteria bacterium]|nr:hypothetical protein [Gammaproteobacteria bacterium]
MSLLGRFLEISVQTGDIRESSEFYEALGFRHCAVGETWPHPYAVLSDGRLFLGLHEYAFPSPAITFARPGLARHLPELERRGVRFEFRKTGEEDFNEAGFLDPDGHMFALLEARTYSPPAFDGRDFSLLGAFGDYALPVRGLERSLTFWQRLDVTPAAQEAAPWPIAILEAGDARIGLHETAGLSRPALRFTSCGRGAQRKVLIDRGFPVDDTPAGPALRSPEGLVLLVDT